MRCAVQERISRLAISLLVIASCPIGCGGDDGALDAERCERVRDHLVQHALASDSTRTDREDRRLIMQRALGQEFLAHCVREMSSERVDCILSASDPKEVAACSSQLTK
jgi:hypothetical protein